MAKTRRAPKIKKSEPKPAKPKLTAEERRQIEIDRWARQLASIPKYVFRALAGVKTDKQVNDQATTYKLAMGTRTINGSRFLVSVFEHLARISRQYAKWDRAGQPNGEGGDTPLERNQRLRGDKLQIEVDRMRAETVARADVHQGLAAFSRIMRDAGELMQRQGTAAAYEILDEALVSAVAAVERVLEKGDEHV